MPHMLYCELYVLSMWSIQDRLIDNEPDHMWPYNANEIIAGQIE